jgi:hypothetical protein
MNRQAKENARSRESENGQALLELLPEDAIRPIEKTVEQGFFDRALDLVKDEAWAHYKNEVHGPALAASEFTAKYTHLLEWAFSEYVGLLAKVPVNGQIRIPWSKLETAAFDFVQRFVEGTYARPWQGAFLMSAVFDARKAAAFKRLHEVGPWQRVSPDVWEKGFVREVLSGPWRHRAIEDAKRHVTLAHLIAKPQESTARSSAPQSQLNDREQKIWEVIRAGPRGMQYCRELEKAGIRPRKKGAWTGAPGTYLAAYTEGQQWRQRIQNEKSKIKQKAKLAKLDC